MKEIVTFLDSNLTEIFAAIITILASLVSIPITLRNLKNSYDETKENEQQLESIPKSKLKTKIVIGKSHVEKVEVDKKENEKEQYVLGYKGNALQELSEKRSIDKYFKKVSFFLAVAMSVLGTIILFSGIMMCLFTSKEVGWITTSAGAIMEFMAGIYFWLVNKTMKEVNNNSKQLEKTENLFTAVELIEKINDTNIRDNTYKEIINLLLTQETR